MKTLQIIATFETVGRAMQHCIDAGKLDISYNERAAWEKAALLDNGAGRNRDGMGLVKAYVVENAGKWRIVYLYRWDIALLNEFDPFISTLDDAPFHIVTIDDTRITIHDARLSRKGRRQIADFGLTVTTLAA